MRILQRHQNQINDRFHRVTRNNEVLIGRLNRIHKRNMADIPKQKQIDNLLRSLEEKLQTRVMASEDEDMENGILGFCMF